MRISCVPASRLCSALVVLVLAALSYPKVHASEIGLFTDIHRDFHPGYLYEQRELLSELEQNRPSDDAVDIALEAQFVARKQSLYLRRCGGALASGATNIAVPLLAMYLTRGLAAPQAPAVGVAPDPALAAQQGNAGMMIGAGLVAGIVTQIAAPVQTLAENAFTCARAFLYSGLPFDSADGYERKYVKIKRFLHPHLQSSIEYALMTDCRHDYGQRSCQQLMEVALNLPLRTQEIDLDEDRFNAVMSNIDSNVRGQLLEHAFLLALGQPSDGRSPRTTERRAIYLYGEPGAGKTHAARKYAEALGVPYAEVAVAKAVGNGLGVQKITGMRQSYFQNEPGLLLQALGTLAKDGSARKNMVIVFSDADRGINANDANNPLRDLMRELTDPSVLTFFSEYLGIEIDLSHVTMIITGNEPIKDASIHDRLLTIHVPNLPDDLRVNIILNEAVPAYFAKAHPSFKSYACLTQEDRDAIQGLITEGSSQSFRELQKRVEQYLASTIRHRVSKKENACVGDQD